MNEMPPSESQVMLTHLDWNLQRLDEVLKQEQSDYFKGAALQRFGHTYDIALKTIQSFAQAKNIPCKANEQCLETAVQNGWMNTTPDWKEIVADYQCINQKPKQDTNNVYSKLTSYHKAFHQLFDQLKKET